MNSGADSTWPIFCATRCQSSSFIRPPRMWPSGTLASADSSRMVISIWLISRLKMAEVRPCLIEAGAGQVEGQGRLAAAGSGGDDHELAGVQAVGQLVEVSEAGRDPGQARTPVLDGLHLVHRRLHQLGQGLVVLGRPAVGDGVDLGLRAVDDHVDVALAGVAHLVDPHRGVDQAPQHGLLPHDLAAYQLALATTVTEPIRSTR